MILAFDCATATGWCAGDGSGLPILGSVTMPRGDDVEHGHFFNFWRRWLVQHVDYIKPTTVVFEKPFLPDNMNGNTVRKLMGLTVILDELCADRKITAREVSPSTIKKHLTGSGKSPKPDMIRCARQCGVSPKTHDEADAFGVWLTAIPHYAKQWQEQWDRKLYAGRGLL